LSPFSGALGWRPHIWLSGEAGSGKTTVVNLIIKRLVAIAESVEGSSTAAGIRQKLEGDSRPVLLDEAERAHVGSDSRLQEILEYLHRFGGYYPGGLFWVDADVSPEALQERFHCILKTLEPEGCWARSVPTR